MREIRLFNCEDFGVISDHPLLSRFFEVGFDFVFAPAEFEFVGAFFGDVHDIFYGYF